MDRATFALIGEMTRWARRPRLCCPAVIILFSLAGATAAQDARPVSDVADLDAIQRAFQKIVDDVAPSVVGIRARKKVPERGYDLADDGGGDQYVVINGSGTVIAPEGLILTNDHVVGGASTIDVLFHDGQRLRGALFASDPRSDLAIIKTSRKNLPPARFCNWTAVARGQWSIALGNPFGLGGDGQLSVAIGVISNLGRHLPGLGEVDDRFYNDMIQVTAPINPGNSGGPLFNIRGELVGIVTAMHTRSAADEGVGFAIPMTPVKLRLVQALSKGEAVEYGYLGVTVRQPDAVERERLGVAYGVVVQRVEPNGPADQAGLRPGDYILRYEQQAVNGPAHLAELAGQSLVGTSVRLEVLHGEKTDTLQVTVAPRHLNRVTLMRGSGVTWRGMRLSDVPERTTPDSVTLPAGVLVVDVEQESPAALAAIKVGDVIADIDGRPVPNTSAFLARIREVQGTAELLLDSGDRREVPPWRKDTRGQYVRAAAISVE
ncbi:MAG: trypsin-like peptidase domain-containing protein [Planctomycetota bacterium]